MLWARSWYLYLLWIVLALIVFFRFTTARRRKALEKFADPGLLGPLELGLSRRRRRWKTVLIVLSVFLIILSLAQPQWGYHWQEVKREGIDIVIAMDTSKSMLARDVKPDRLDRAKLQVRELLDYLQGDRIALVAFAGESYTICPLTLDYGAVNLFLKAVKVGVVPLGGTDIGGAIEDAIKIFKGSERKHKALIVISDGEDLTGNAEKAAGEANRLGVKIFSVGIGSREGELIPVEEEGQKAYLKDREGQLVQSRLNESTLQQIALLTGGAYVHASGGKLGLVDLYNEKISRMEKKELGVGRKKVYENRYQWPLSIALILLCVEMFLSERRRSPTSISSPPQRGRG